MNMKNGNYISNNTESLIFTKFLICLFCISSVLLLRNWQQNNIAISTLVHSFPNDSISQPKINLAKPKMYVSSILAANSRLGNHLFELSSLYGISKKLKRIPTFFIQDYYHDQMIKDTDFLIPGLIDQFLIVNGTVPQSIVPTEFGMKCCIFDDTDRLKNITDEYLHLGGHHYHSWKYFARLRNKFMSFLKKPTTNFTDLPISSEDTIITCVHIRRTDFVGTGFHMAEENFILNSIKYIEKEETKRNNVNMNTVFFGDDFEFMEGLVNGTFLWSEEDINTKSFISHNSPSDDILYARYHCESVLITSPHSTFGWWMGYLSKGNQVYYNDIRFTDDQSIAVGNFNPDDYYPPHWTPIKYGDVFNATVVESFKK